MLGARSETWVPGSRCHVRATRRETITVGFDLGPQSSELLGSRHGRIRRPHRHVAQSAAGSRFLAARSTRRLRHDRWARSPHGTKVHYAVRIVPRRIRVRSAERLPVTAGHRSGASSVRVEGFLSLPPPSAVPEAERRQGIGRAGGLTAQRSTGACGSETLLNRDFRYGSWPDPLVA